MNTWVACRDQGETHKLRQLILVTERIHNARGHTLIQPDVYPEGRGTSLSMDEDHMICLDDKRGRSGQYLVEICSCPDLEQWPRLESRPPM